MHSNGAVIVMQMPERLSRAEAEMFHAELRPLLEVDHPRIVFDFSCTRDMESAGVEMLLHCMEEAMRRDGDVKLSSLTPSSAVLLELMKVDRLFEIFDTPEEAVRSFQAGTQYQIPQGDWVSSRPGDLETAA